MDPYRGECRKKLTNKYLTGLRDRRSVSVLFKVVMVKWLIRDPVHNPYKSDLTSSCVASADWFARPQVCQAGASRAKICREVGHAFRVRVRLRLGRYQVATEVEIRAGSEGRD